MSEKKQSSYQKLFSNTIILAIGSFSSKLLVLFLIPIYTNVLSQSELGTTDIITQAANWLLPIITLTISEAVIRFGLDKAYDKRQVFTIGNLVCLCGLLALGIIIPFVGSSNTLKQYIGDYALLLYIYVITSSMKTLYSIFVRSMEKVNLFAINGLLTTFFTVLFTVLFLIVFKMGITGYLLAIILSDLLSIIFLTIVAKLWRYIDIKSLDTPLAKQMLKYSLPLIPTQLLWLLSNIANSTMTIHFLGQAENGILATSYKIPNIIATIYTMFGQAWNMSAITENDSENREKFYENVFNMNQTIMYVLAAGILLVVKPITFIWIGAQFRDAYLYSPILIFSTIFSCFITFLSSVYIVTKKTKRSFTTSFISVFIGIIFSFIFIPIIGIYGAAISNILAFVTVFIIRLIDARKLINFKVDYKKMLLNCTILALMVLTNYLNGILSYALLLTGFILILILNYKYLFKMAKAILPKKILRFMPFIK